MKEKIEQTLIANNSDPLIFDTFTALIINLKGQDFTEFKDEIENYFWEIQNDCHIITDAENDEHYKVADIKEEFLEVADVFDIKYFWGVQNLADLTNTQIANYMFSAIEKDKINKINEILFKLINP